MSVGFIVADDGDQRRQGASKPNRTINQLQTLGEISVVSKPTYDDTSINVTRSIKQFEDERTRKYKEKVRAYLDGLSDQLIIKNLFFIGQVFIFIVGKTKSDTELR